MLLTIDSDSRYERTLYIFLRCRRRGLCPICSYVYDPAKGDEEKCVSPGTAFEDLPDDWLCPLYQQGKDVFEKIS